MDKIWGICPICDKKLEQGIPTFYGADAWCDSCKYKWQNNGNYASTVTIGDEVFELDDMGFGDGEKLEKRVKELRSQI